MITIKTDWVLIVRFQGGLDTRNINSLNTCALILESFSVWVKQVFMMLCI